MGKHSVGYRYSVGGYVRKPRMVSALNVIRRLVDERNLVRLSRGAAWADMEAMPTRNAVTRHSGR